MELKHFTRDVFVFLLPLILLMMIVYGTFFKLGFEPLFTNSTSLDLKLLDLRSHKFKNIEVLSIGSSMTLNNLNSSEIKLTNKSDTYYNFGAWGLQIADTLYLLEYLTKIYKLKCVVISSSLPDFCEKDKITIPKHTELALINSYLPYFYTKSSILQIIDRHRQKLKYKADSYGYDNLNYDESGGVVFNIPKENISLERWNEGLSIPTNATQYQYDKLRELALFLKNNQIVFLFAQAPIKKSLFSSQASSAVINDHFNKCQSIVNKNGGNYINLHNPSVFDDGLFVDQYHLNGAGSKIYTKQISSKLFELLDKNQTRTE